MCDTRDGKYIAGHSAGIGWYVGIIDGRGVRLSRVIILRSEHSEFLDSGILLTDKFVEFDSPEAAMKFADEKGCQ